MNRSIDRTQEALRVERALKLALEALKDYRRSDDDRVSVAMGILQEALAAVPEAHKQPAPVAEPHKQQEPVAWKDRTYGNLHHQDFGNSIPLYTSPPNVPTARASKPEDK